MTTASWAEREPIDPLAAWSVVLVRTQGPINLGMILRACANTGLQDLRLVQTLCAPDCDDARKFANHARDRLASLPLHPDLGSALHDRDLVIGTSGRPRDPAHGRALDLRELPALIRDRGAQRPALVFGNEADGLDDGELAHCQVYVHLPTPGDYPSYNLSHAVAICLFQLVQMAVPLPRVDDPQADMDDRERLIGY
ncbi:MAG: RNA methyltransferase, partial [Planctomycetota bacterium]